MPVEAEKMYHIYNRGNNSQQIFFDRNDYLLFLRKVRHPLLPHVDILAYCLMPNHFHFVANTFSDLATKKFQQDLRMMLSSYTRVINYRLKRTGSLFQQNTKIKPLEVGAEHYPFICFHYVHQNPLRANLVKQMEDWEFSSFRDYTGMRNGTLCNREMAHQLLNLPKEVAFFVRQSHEVIDPEVARRLF